MKLKKGFSEKKKALQEKGQGEQKKKKKRDVIIYSVCVKFNHPFMVLDDGNTIALLYYKLIKDI